MQPHKNWTLEPLVRRTVYLPPRTMDQVRTLAQNAQVSVSEILRRAIDQALDQRYALPPDPHEPKTSGAFVYLPRALDARLVLAAQTMLQSKAAMMRRLVLFYVEREAWRHGQ
ncbi:MAG: ribbon-helix-helix domain-containing protein [Firmicutes bacterium]|nr:ribbon-helix-helix domain-containing protein [Bacillota bacterium]